MRFLIDTHYLVWAAVSPWDIEPWAREILNHPENAVLVSAASVYEIGVKVRKGQIPEAIEFERGLVRNVAAMGFTLLDLKPEVMWRAARLTASHKDPFDRIIAAQAIELDMDLLSVDAQMDAFGVRRLLGT